MTQHFSIGTAWTEAAAGLRRERRLLAPIVLGLIVLPSIVSGMIQREAAPSVASVDAAPGWWMLAVIVIVLVMMVGQMAVVLLVNGWRGSVGQAIGRAARRLPMLLLAGLILIVPLVLILAVVGGLGGVSTAPGQMSGGAAAATLVVMALMLFVSMRLLPMIAFAVTGDDGPLALLRRTWRATSGHFWKLFGFFLLWVVAFLIVAVATAAVVGTVVTLAMGRPEPWSVSLLVLAVLTGLVQGVFMTLYSAILARIAVQLDGEPEVESISGT